MYLDCFITYNKIQGNTAQLTANTFAAHLLADYQPNIYTGTDIKHYPKHSYYSHYTHDTYMYPIPDF